MRWTLEKEGYRVEWASGGEEGLRKARRRRPELITLDVMMPGMDGWTVLAALKSDPDLADIPVIMMTIVENKNLGYALGATDYLTKPIDRKRLSELLGKLRGRPDARTALIVDDDPAAREVVRDLLEKDGWEVAEAENGRVGLERVARHQPDLIILDLMMPEMDGFEFAGELRRNQAWRSIPILVVTARDVTEQERQALNGFILGVLQKGSYSRDELLQEVRSEVAARTRGRARGEGAHDRVQDGHAGADG
jgi:CheY-like chemotaxis protein